MNCLKAYGSNRFFRSTSPFCRLSTGSGDTSQSSGNTPAVPEEPTTCCMSGCNNCVWIEYAEQLSKIFNDGGLKSKDIILSKVSDPNMKAFLLMELRNIEQQNAQKDS